MMLLTRLLETIYISSPASRSEFSESDLEKLANLILNASGVINPIVVKQVAPLSFTVVEGHFEFYASLKAKEINPTFEEIQVLILTGDSQTDESISEQIKLLRNKPSNGSSKDNDEYKNLEKLLLDRFSQLEAKITPPQPPYIDLSRIEQLLVSHQQSIIASLNKDIPTDTVYLPDRIAEQLQRQINTLEVFHEDNVKTIRHLKAELQNANKKTIDRIEKFIDDLNKLSLEELKTKFDRYGIQKKSIASSANKVINLRPFTSLIDIKKALSDATIVKLLNQWE